MIKSLFILIMTIICVAAFVNMLGSFIAGLAGCASINDIKDRVQDVTNNVPVIVDPVSPVVHPETNTPALQFDRSKCKFNRIDAGTLEWAVTRTLTVSKVTSDRVYSSCTGTDWPKRKDGLQGCFALAVEQPNGSIVVGTFDYNRAKHQPMKGFDNLYGKEHSFFGITKGCRVWIFTTASNRDSERTVRERTNLVPFIWEWAAPKPSVLSLLMFWK